jgi:signal recognition particle subunit SEC65
MKVIKRMELIEDVACTLQAKFTFKDIDIFLAEFGFNEGGDHNSYNSKRIYVKDKLRKISIKDLAKIAEELDIRVPNVVKVPPKNWENSNSAKAFISHISKDKKIAKFLFA